MKLKIYVLQDCPHCEELEEFLDNYDVPYEVADLASPETLAELRSQGIFAMEAPIITVNYI
jgi:glutaredoxin